ncbi:unnamed protein product, partial [Prorocentrum cordatum]
AEMGRFLRHGAGGADDPLEAWAREHAGAGPAAIEAVRSPRRCGFGGVLLVLDGLDQAGGPVEVAEACRWLGAWAQEDTDARWAVATTRPEVLEAQPIGRWAPRAPFAAVRLQPLGARGCEELCLGLLRRRTQEAAGRAEIEDNEGAEHGERARELAAGVRELAGPRQPLWPGLAELLCRWLLQEEAEAPEGPRPSSLGAYGACALGAGLLWARAGRLGAPGARGQLEPGLRSLALRLFQRGDWCASDSEAGQLSLLPFLVPAGAGLVRFVAPAFQEHFAAAGLLERLDVPPQVLGARPLWPGV